MSESRVGTEVDPRIIAFEKAFDAALGKVITHTDQFGLTWDVVLESGSNDKVASLVRNYTDAMPHGFRVITRVSAVAILDKEDGYNRSTHSWVEAIFVEDGGEEESFSPTDGPIAVALDIDGIDVMHSPDEWFEHMTSILQNATSQPQ